MEQRVPLCPRQTWWTCTAGFNIIDMTTDYFYNNLARNSQTDFTRPSYILGFDRVLFLIMLVEIKCLLM